jgi:hypothetical protein
MDHEIVLNLRRVAAVPGAFGLRLSVANWAHVRLALPHPDHRGLQFESIAAGEACQRGWWIEEVTGFRPLVLEPGASAAYGWRVWPCDRAERRPWRWLAGGDGWCVDLPRSGSPFRAEYALEVGRDFFDLGSHAGFGQLAYMAREAGAEVWEGRATSNRVEFTRWF